MFLNSADQKSENEIGSHIILAEVGCCYRPTKVFMLNSHLHGLGKAETAFLYLTLLVITRINAKPREIIWIILSSEPLTLH